MTAQRNINFKVLKQLIKNKVDDLIKQLTVVQELMDKVLLEIGLKYSVYHRTQDETLVKSINEKVELYQKLELRMQDLERQIREQAK